MIPVFMVLAFLLVAQHYINQTNCGVSIGYGIMGSNTYFTLFQVCVRYWLESVDRIDSWCWI